MAGGRHGVLSYKVAIKMIVAIAAEVEIIGDPIVLELDLRSLF